MLTAESRVEAVRAFNRFYTGVIGALDEGLLSSPYTLTEARVIFELAQEPDAGRGVEVVDLRRALQLDPGYLSRILARFEADGLVSRWRSESDARRGRVQLTDQGRGVFATLDARSAEQVHALLGGRSTAAQRRVLDAMDTIRADLEGGYAPPDGRRAVLLRAPRPGEYGWMVARHGALYAAEYGWDATFEALVARIVADHVETHESVREAAWVAELDGEPLGCVLCVAKDDVTAQLRILLVEPSARGLGVGTRLVEQCLRFARDAGYERMVLWTNDVLVSARRIYEAAGFVLTDEEPHHSFGRDLVGQHWVRAL